MPVYGHKRLRWSDFRKVPKSLDGEHDASTAPSISWRITHHTDSGGNWSITKVVVRLGLAHHDTWVVRGKEKGQGASDLLAHEEGHYDIAAVAARMIEAKLTGLSGDKTQNPDDVANTIVNEINEVQKEVNDRYDEDLNCGTNHGTRPGNQAAWIKGIKGVQIKPEPSLKDLMNFCPRDGSAAAVGAGQ